MRLLSWTAALAFAAAAVIADGAAAQQGSGGGKQRMLQFKVVDANDDGFIGADEVATRHESVFAAMDADDDDTLTLEEYMAVRFGPGAGGTGTGPRRAAMDARKKARFQSMDRDGDGRVRKLEFLRAGEEQHRAADTDGDGKVSVWEHRAARRY